MSHHAFERVECAIVTPRSGEGDIAQRRRTEFVTVVTIPGHAFATEVFAAIVTHTAKTGADLRYTDCMKFLIAQEWTVMTGVAFSFAGKQLITASGFLTDGIFVTLQKAVK